ncbi:MAG: hypothetical protein KDI68_02405 [Gammaproteobacteria bacterium]|nr:hypothetical protein [Gammaproteobacteria bacterium]
MGQLSDHSKRILAGLAREDAGEFHSMHYMMMRVPGVGEQRSKTQALLPPPSGLGSAALHRIALISDGRGAGGTPAPPVLINDRAVSHSINQSAA